MLGLLLPSVALSFQPSTDVYIGIEPNRNQFYNIERQYQFRHDEAWQAFLSEDGKDWHAAFDEATGLPFRAWGPPIWLGQPNDALEAERLALQFIQNNSGLFQSKISQFQDVKAVYQSGLSSWLIEAQQRIGLSRPVTGLNGELIEAAPVWRGKLKLRLRSGWINWFGAQHFPLDVQPLVTADITASTAVEVALKENPHTNSTHTNVSAELMFLPVQESKDLKLVLVWCVHSETIAPRGKWVSYVDAQTGELRHLYNTVRYLEGTLSAQHDTRTVDGNFSTSPLRFVQDGLETDETGFYSTSENGVVDIGLAGLYTIIENQAGSNAQLNISGGDQVFDDASASQAEIDQYIFQNRIYDWAEVHAPHIVAGWPQSEVNVNLDQTCNAYFDGTLNFFRSGDGCNNTGRISDISYHEWGHGFHYYNLLSGEYDGSMSEGISDAVAFFQTNSPYIAPYFGADGGAIREVSNDRVYPDDITGGVHADGLIFAGAIWDLWDEMNNVYPEEEAYRQTINIFVEGLRSGPTIPESFDAILLADDDNADLADGTPNQCTIIDAFSRHGLGFNGGQGLVSIGHLPLGNQTSNTVDYALNGDVIVFAEECTDASIDTVDVYYSVDDGVSWESWPLELNGEQVVGAIPVVEPGQVVHYYIQAQDTDGASTTVPSGGTINPFSFYVGELEELFCTDFEDDDGEFTHELLSGDDQEGADDWMWGAPLGLSGDPSFAYSGENVWGNDLGGGNYNGAYQNDKWNRLTSPEIDVSSYDDIVLTYQRWLSVEDGFYDKAQITANDLVLWGNHATQENIGDEHHEDEQWAPHSLFVSTGGSESVQFGWEIISDAGLEFGGWTIDDVCVYGVVPPSTDSDGSNSADGEGYAKDDLFVGCSCSTNSQPATGWLMGIGLLGIVFHRRRKDNS